MHRLLVRHLFYPLHERLKGKATFRWLARLEESQWWTPARLGELQLERLRAHLAYAYAHVPYYRQLLDRHAVSPARVTSLDDFARVPFLTRPLLRQHFDALRSRKSAGRVQALATGGSTGTPVRVLVDMHRMGFGEAARLRAHRWFRIEPGAREVVLWGAPFELDRQGLGRALRDRLLNSRLLSAFDLGEPALARYGRSIARYAPTKMYGYASALHLLARYLEATGWKTPGSLRGVFTTAEPLYDFQRRTIEAVFGCPAAVEYGSRDGGMVANECPAGGLHIPVEGMHVEIVDPDPDGIGEVVVTILDSFAFPIIRYRTGDLGSLENRPCPCGRGLPRLRGLEGRQTDFLVTPDGRFLHALAAIYALREIPSIREFRLVQDAVDRVVVELVPEPDFSPADERKIQAGLAAALGPGVHVEIAPSTSLKRTAAGKFRYVTSTVAEAYVADLVRSAGRTS